MILASVAQDILRAVLQGMPPGTVYALIALGFVLTYKTSGVFNLAFGAQAYISAAMYFQARNEWEWGALPAFVLAVLLVAPALGLLLERLIFRHLRTASAISKLVVTIGLSVALPNLFELVIGFEPVAGRTPEGLVPNGNGPPFYDPFGVYGWSRNELTQMAVALLAIAILGAIFRFTALGLAMRAVVESPRMTELAGVRADRVSAFAWALSSLFAGLAGVLIAPRFNTLEDIAFFELMVIGIAAAAIGLLVSMPRAMLGGLAIGIVIALSNTFLPRWADGRDWLQPLVDNFTLALPFLVLFGILVFSPRIRASTEAADPLAGVDPPPPQSAALTRSSVLTLATRVFALLVLAVGGWWVFTQADTSWIFLVTQGVIMSVIFLSITVMTGMAGQISLCQGTFAAIGAFSVYQLAERWEVSVLAGALIGAAIAAVVGSLLSLPV
ncbi:MAG: ABC transporter permease, partial [Acidimicrobiia bacterium]|nr:ABC transporter permease [Acidimicrobiia bacterium]